MTQLLLDPYVIVILLLLGLAFIFYINRFKLNQIILNFKTQRCLNSLGIDQIKNLTCPDGLGGNFIIDRLILLDHSILIINHKKYAGKIFGSEKIDEWTQMLGHKSYKFPNPLYNLNIQLQTISKCIPDVSVEAYLFFDSSAHFPNQIPSNTIHPNHLEPRLLSYKKHKVKPEIMLAWKKLQQMSA